MRSSPDRSTKSTRSHSCDAPTARRHGISGSLSLPSRGPFHLSFTVLCSIGRQGYLALRGGPRSFPQGFSCPVVLWILLLHSGYSYGAFTLFGRPSQGRSASLHAHVCSPEPQHARMLVWAPPVSLAATPGIEFSFFSSGYLDVSVRRVPLRTLLCRYRHCSCADA